MNSALCSILLMGIAQMASGASLVANATYPQSSLFSLFLISISGGAKRSFYKGEMVLTGTDCGAAGTDCGPKGTDCGNGDLLTNLVPLSVLAWQS